MPLDDEEIIETLNYIKSKGHRILARPDGEVAGIVYEEEPYFDEKYERKRRRVKYIDLDGRERTEPRDAISKKQGVVDLITDVEKFGGVAVTQLVGNGSESKIRPVITGKNAKKMRDQFEDKLTLQRELDRMKKEQRELKRHKENLEREKANLKSERGEMESDLESFRHTNQRISAENDRLRQRNKGLKAIIDSLESTVESLKSEGKEREEDVESALKSIKKRKKELAKIKSPEVSVEETREEKTPEEGEE